MRLPRRVSSRDSLEKGWVLGVVSSPLILLHIKTTLFHLRPCLDPLWLLLGAGIVASSPESDV